MNFCSPPSSVTFPGSREHITFKTWETGCPVFGLSLSGYATLYQFIAFLISSFLHQESRFVRAPSIEHPGVLYKSNRNCDSLQPVRKGCWLLCQSAKERKQSSRLAHVEAGPIRLAAMSLPSPSPPPGVETFRSMVLQGLPQAGPPTAYAHKEDQAPAACQ